MQTAALRGVGQLRRLLAGQRAERDHIVNSLRRLAEPVGGIDRITPATDSRGVNRLASIRISERGGVRRHLGALRRIRLRLLSLIASHPGGQACVCEISSTFDVSQPTISHHLKMLRSAGLLDCERRGTWVYYWVIPQALQQLSSVLHLDDRVIEASQECCP